MKNTNFLQLVTIKSLCDDLVSKSSKPTPFEFNISVVQINNIPHTIRLVGNYKINSIDLKTVYYPSLTDNKPISFWQHSYSNVVDKIEEPITFNELQLKISINQKISDG